MWLVIIYSLRDAFRSHESVRVNDQQSPRGGLCAASLSSGRGLRVDITISIFFRRLYISCFIGGINSRRILAIKISLNYSQNFTRSGGPSSVNVHRRRRKEGEKDRIGRADGSVVTKSRVAATATILEPRQYFRINRSFMCRRYETATAYNLPYDAHYR